MHLSPLPERSNLSSADVQWLNELRDTVNVLASNANLSEDDYANAKDKVIEEREKVAAEAIAITQTGPTTPADRTQMDIDARVENALTRLLRRAGINVPGHVVSEEARQGDWHPGPFRGDDVVPLRPDDEVPLGPTTTPVPVGGDKGSVIQNPTNVDPFRARSERTGNVLPQTNLPDALSENEPTIDVGDVHKDDPKKPTRK